MECLREYALRKNYLIERGSIESLEVGEDWGPFCGVAVCTLCKIFFMVVARQATCNAWYQTLSQSCINGGWGTYVPKE
jgi:hypothetical protein